MKIEMRKIGEVVPYEHNPRRNDHAVDAVAESIRQFGFKVPIVVDKDGVIVAGHTRLKAAVKLGLEEVPCVVADDLSEDQVKAFRLADNKVGELAAWDFTELEKELAEIDIDMSAFGFPEAEDIDTEEIVEDEAPDDPEPRCKTGDIWALGDHRLICGDSTDKEVVYQLTQGEKIDMLYTDPPYGMNLDTDYSGMKNHLDMAQEKHLKNGRKYDAGKVDDFSPAMISSCLDIKAGEIFLWGANYYAELIPSRNDGSWIVWDKRANGNGDDAEDYSSDKMYGSCFELCWSKKAHKQDIARVKWAGVFGTEQEFDHKRHHPTQKPIALSAWFVNRFTKAGDAVLDLFGGSGSTLIACEQLGRKCYMAEIDPHYCDVIIQRWENLTGRTATLIND